jgi:hypothetical protein
MSCELPSSSNIVSIFTDSKTESEAFVLNGLGNDRDKVFIGRLNLQRLGFFNQMSRLCGNLSTLYIVRNISEETQDSDNGANDRNGN